MIAKKTVKPKSGARADLLKLFQQCALDNVVEKLNGIGPCMIRNRIEPACSYVKKGHPGCAIGCQPGFRKAFLAAKDKLALSNTSTITALYGTAILSSEAEAKALLEILINGFEGETASKLVSFWQALQGLHDEDENWKKKRLVRSAVMVFAKKFGLRVPKSQYA